jgi:NAD(P)-dependent dehydrogenase (short-subunit alcohol dehydrogenase family)
MMMQQLAGKVAIVTGASSGIGYATARLFAREGASLIVTARRRAKLDALVDAIAGDGGNAVAVPGDVRDEALAERLVSAAAERFGGLDVAFNNAATLGETVPVTQTTLAGWRETLEINLTSAFLGAKYQLPAMIERGGGSIIFTTSFIGRTATLPGMGSYAASKAALSGLMQAIAVEAAPHGIRANCIAPGGTDTQLAPQDPESRRFAEGMHALKRFAAPEEIARSVLYLASDASSFVTGTTLMVDGGVSINRV